MIEMLINNESNIRVVFFVCTIILVFLWECFLPRRKFHFNRTLRWLTNLGLVFFNTLILRFIFSLTAVSAALWAEKNQIGLFNSITFSFIFSFIFSIIFLDLIIYLQHRLFHKAPYLWSLHKVHHTDLDLDVSTGVRFHLLEFLISMIIKILFIMIIGAPPASIIVFEILLNSITLFNHGNIYIPKRIDLILRYFIVTPDMHRIHHSVYLVETNSNYGFNLPYWDYIFKTYTEKPKDSHKLMRIGLAQYKDSKKLGFINLLKLPFIKE